MSRSGWIRRTTSAKCPSCSGAAPDCDCSRLGGDSWLWPGAPAEGIDQVTLTVGRVAWRFGDEARGAVVRLKVGVAGEFEIHGCAFSPVAIHAMANGCWREWH